MIRITLCALLLLCGCSIKHTDVGLKGHEQQSVLQLQERLQSLSPHINPDEARLIAIEAHTYPKILANRYSLTTPPQLHNFLVNVGIKDRGLCYQWAQDLGNHLRSFQVQSLQIYFAKSNRNAYDEHNSVVVSARGASLREGIVLDPWRNSSQLYWVALSEDPIYQWEAQ